MTEALLTTDEVAELLRVHPKQVYRLIRSDGLPARKVGGEWRFLRREVLGWSGRGRDLEVSSRPRVTPLVAANGDVAIEVFLDVVEAGGKAVIGLVLSDSGRALGLFEQKRVSAVGFHGGDPPSHVGSKQLARIHLVDREVGLVARASARVPSLAALPEMRLASRPATAGIRHHLDVALTKSGIDPVAAHGSAVILGSHRDVVLAVARGEADVGIASRAWAARLGLAFVPVAVEPYGLVVDSATLGDPTVLAMAEAAQSDGFRRSVEAAPGYDASSAGEIRLD